MLETPAGLILYRKIEQRGLGLRNIKIKDLAQLITTFLQTAQNRNFQESLYHNTLYRIYCLDDDSLPKIDRPPYYTQYFFNNIKKLINNTTLNPIYMSLKQWYDYLLEEVADDQGRQVPKKGWTAYSDIDWQKFFQ